MTRSFARFVAAIMLGASGFLIAVSAVGVILAKTVVVGGPIPVRPADLALLSDLAALAPFIAVFGLVNLVAAVGLLLDSPWGMSAAAAVSAIGATIGGTGLTLLILGRDPFASLSSNHALDGIEMVGTFTGWFVLVLVALAIHRLDGRERTSFAAA